MTIKIFDEQIECISAVKGADFVEIVLADGSKRRDSGISDFSGYELEGGEWEAPPLTDKERLDALEAAMLAVIMGVMNI